MAEATETKQSHGSMLCGSTDQGFAGFAECVASPVLLLTPDARIRCANSTFVRTMGVQSERFLHRTLPSHWLTQPVAALPRWRALLHQAAQGDTRPDPIRLSMRSADGLEINMQVHAAPWPGAPDGLPHLVVATFVHVHEAKEFEDESTEELSRHDKQIQMSSDLLFALDPMARFLSINKPCQERLGYAADDVIGTSALDLVCPEFHGVCHESIKTVLSGQPVENLQFRVTTKPGDPIDALVNLTPVFDAAGTVSRILGTARDITELRQIQEELERSEERLRILFQHAPDGCYLCDLQGRFLDVNRATAEISGRTREELIGASILEIGLVPESQRSMVTDLLSQAVPGQPLPRTEFRACRRDGTEGVVEITGHPVTIQGQTLLLGAARDVTERKRDEAKLKESLSLLRATLESTADGIVVVDDQGRVKDFNEQFKDLWQLPSEVIESRDNRRVWAVVEPQLTDPDAFQAAMDRIQVRPERENNGILHFKDGRVIEYCLKPQWLGDEIVGRVWSFRDVTKAYHAQQAQEQLLHQVAQINEELSHFAYVVSHDLKAPLRGIKMLTEWLCADGGDQFSGEVKENLRLLQNRVERMHNLIEGVLQYSRIGRVQEDRVAVNLNELVPEIIDAIAPPEHVTITVDGPLPTLKCEPTRIGQVFQNLLSNAVKYVDKPVGRITVACEETDDIWTFRVADNGPGIEPRHVDRIFKIFQTLTARDEFESTGVGLTLVKKIVELSGGKIWVESEVGQGSTFFFTSPKQPVVSQDGAAPTEAASRGKRPGETVVTQRERTDHRCRWSSK